jgi:dihydrofolate reductase
MTILGSGKIVAQLASEGLIDEYQLVVNPIALGKGRTMFEGVKAPVNLKRVSTREFKNGNILTVYSA